MTSRKPGPPHPADQDALEAWDLVPARTALHCPATIRRWAELLAEHPTAHRLYHSPAWFAHLAAQAEPDERAIVAIARVGGAICGLAPLVVGRDRLRFRAAGRTFGSSHLIKVSVQGGRALIPDSPALTSLLRHFV
jgi:CelD/BcsL family acetyltransferase involved in cellulose biosynthesis